MLTPALWGPGLSARGSVQVAVGRSRSLVVDAHGEQNCAIHQKVTLGRSDVAPVRMLAEDRAGLLERLIDSKHCNHSSHLRSQAYRQGGMAGAGALVLTAGGSCYLMLGPRGHSARSRDKDVGALSQLGHFGLGHEALHGGGQPRDDPR